MPVILWLLGVPLSLVVVLWLLGVVVTTPMRLAIGQELPHSIESTQDVLGRIGVGQAHIAFAENAEVRPADDGDAGILQQRRRRALWPSSRCA